MKILRKVFVFFVFIVGLFIISFVALDFKTTKKVRGKLMLLCLVATIGFIIYKYYPNKAFINPLALPKSICP